MERVLYPFCALVGQEPMKRALLLNAVDPTLGGVLISGHKGTGKSTAVRGLVPLLPAVEVVVGCAYHCSPLEPASLCDECSARVDAGDPLKTAQRTMPFVELPLSATEDRLVGTLDVEQALRTGARKFEAGLLAAANRGILYVDEVNLLDDHLVDMLLDAAASGINVVEREGVSIVHPARFLLVGTMNPEEGDLRPQFLDRFGLCVNVTGVATLEERLEVVRRRADFDRDPKAFAERWKEDGVALGQRVDRARQTLANVVMQDDTLEAAVRLAERSGARGQRAEIALVRTARALAAWRDSTQVSWEDVAEAAYFVLPHRMPEARLASVETLQQRVGEILELAGVSVETAELEDAELMQVPGATAAGSILLSAEKKSPTS